MITLASFVERRHTTRPAKMVPFEDSVRQSVKKFACFRMPEDKGEAGGRENEKQREPNNLEKVVANAKVLVPTSTIRPHDGDCFSWMRTPCGLTEKKPEEPATNTVGKTNTRRLTSQETFPRTDIVEGGSSL